ncbi:hypothetical protein N865_19165 [Intrasporangium oryzae NRRL B-24470]|uniref:Uncharacterized protein n=1 Tax=Intrasporangium oryzae NRRL B-24470 TaxID=1386089 RepID=W9GAZ1_9MICO|nr:hypothetical protein N865_19165 [Intrasporangium oryzae NRRL B-24470]
MAMGPVVVFVVVPLAVGIVVWGSARWWRGRDGTARAGGGRTKVDVVVAADNRWEVAKALPAEDSLHVLSHTEGHLVLALRDLTGPGTRHFRHHRDGLAETLYEQLLPFGDSSGRTLLIGPTEASGWPRLNRLFTGPRQPPISKWQLVRTSFPRLASFFGFIGLAAFGLVNLIYWTGRDVSANVLGISDETCWVEWVVGGQRYTAGVDCFESADSYGGSLLVRALAGPFNGLAWDQEATFAVLAFLTLVPAGVSLALGTVLAMRRANRVPRPLTLLDPIQDAPPKRSADSALAELMPAPAAPGSTNWLEELARLADRDDWAAGTGDPPAWWQRLGHGLWDALLTAVVVLAVIIFGEVYFEAPFTVTLPDGIVVTVGVIVVVFVGRLAYVAVQHRPPRTEDWAYLTARLKSDWILLLMDQGEPQWRLTLLGKHHPGLKGDCRTPELSDNRYGLDVQINGVTWPTTSVDRIRADRRSDLLRGISSIR